MGNDIMKFQFLLVSPGNMGYNFGFFSYHSSVTYCQAIQQIHENNDNEKNECLEDKRDEVNPRVGMNKRQFWFWLLEGIRKQVETFCLSSQWVGQKIRFHPQTL